MSIEKNQRMLQEKNQRKWRRERPCLLQTNASFVGSCAVETALAVAKTAMAQAVRFVI